MRYSFSQRMIIKTQDIQLHTMSYDVSVPVISNQHMSTCRGKEIINIRQKWMDITSSSIKIDSHTLSCTTCRLRPSSYTNLSEPQEPYGVVTGKRKVDGWSLHNTDNWKGAPYRWWTQIRYQMPLIMIEIHLTSASTFTISCLFNPFLRK